MENLTSGACSHVDTERKTDRNDTLLLAFLRTQESLAILSGGETARAHQGRLSAGLYYLRKGLPRGLSSWHMKWTLVSMATCKIDDECTRNDGADDCDVTAAVEYEVRAILTMVVECSSHCCSNECIGVYIPVVVPVEIWCSSSRGSSISSNGVYSSTITKEKKTSHLLT